MRDKHFEKCHLFMKPYRLSTLQYCLRLLLLGLQLEMKSWLHLLLQLGLDLGVWVYRGKNRSTGRHLDLGLEVPAGLSRLHQLCLL